MKTVRVSDSYMIVLNDSECSVATTDIGADLFGGKKATFYKVGAFEVNIPFSNLLEIVSEANKHIKKHESKVT